MPGKSGTDANKQQPLWSYTSPLHPGLKRELLFQRCHGALLDCLGASLPILAWLPQEVTLAVNMVCLGQGQAEVCTLGLALPLFAFAMLFSVKWMGRHI